MVEYVFRVVRDGKAFLAHDVAQADGGPERFRGRHIVLRVHCGIQRTDGCAVHASCPYAQIVQRGDCADFIGTLCAAAAEDERSFRGNQRPHQSRTSIFAISDSISAVFSMPISAELMQTS